MPLVLLSCLFIIAGAFTDSTSVREGIGNNYVASSSNTSTIIRASSASSLNLSQSSPKNRVISEGGSVSPTRPHAIIKPAVIASNVTPASLPVKPVHELPVPEMEVPPVHDHAKQSVPKKGVKLPAQIIPSNNLTESKKPRITESDTDYVGSGEELNNLIVDQVEIDPLAGKKTNSSDYIVPIVAVILSVPLVAILFSTLYKRGADWWQHRNYKRMDFLIEGIYHN